MVDFRKRHKINKRFIAVTGVVGVYQDIIPAQSGFAIGLVSVIATNLDETPHALTLYEGATKVAPPIIIPSSGTFFWDTPGGEQLELSISSGLTGNISTWASGVTGVEVGAYYVLHDERTPITKRQARTVTYG